jgi:hypothetical protein
LAAALAGLKKDKKGKGNKPKKVKGSERQAERSTEEGVKKPPELALCLIKCSIENLAAVSPQRGGSGFYYSVEVET